MIVVVALLAIAGFALLPFLAFGAPVPYEMLFSYKIFYYHVPAAWMMFVSVFVCGIASVGYLVTRRPSWDDVALAAGDLTVLMGALVLTSGPIWGRAHWGWWWVWDARLTQSLLLWMIFVAYALVRRYGGPGSERLAAGLAVFGAADVPLVYFAVNMWRTQHPSNSVVPHLGGQTRLAMWLGVGAYLLLYVILLLVRARLRRSERLVEEIEDLALVED